MQQLRSGVDAIDELIEGLRVGDNLVVQIVDHTVPAAYFVDRFVAAAAGRRVVIADLAGRRGPRTVENVEVLDWSATTAEQMQPILADADRRAGEHAAFVFDSLTMVQERSGSQAALALFLWACPRLYRRHRVALWIVDRDQHDPAFLARLADITQVVVDVRGADGAVEVAVTKADGRPSSVVGRTIQATFEDGELIRVGPVVGERLRVGSMVRTLRTTRGMSQAELARRVGITPSALSQVERGVRGLAAESLMRVWETLGVPFGPNDPLLRGYRVVRRGGHTTAVLAPGVHGQRLADDAAAGRVWRVTIDPGAAGRQPVFAVKGPEIVWVLGGVLDVDVTGHTGTLHEGDTLVITDAVLSGWANPGHESAELIWFLPGSHR